jgi:hypothetical protein
VVPAGPLRDPITAPGAVVVPVVVPVVHQEMVLLVETVQKTRD